MIWMVIRLRNPKIEDVEAVWTGTNLWYPWAPLRPEGAAVYLHLHETYPAVGYVGITHGNRLRPYRHIGRQARWLPWITSAKRIRVRILHICRANESAREIEWRLIANTDHWQLRTFKMHRLLW